MNTTIHKLLQLCLLLFFLSLVLNGCAQRRVYYPQEPNIYPPEQKAFPPMPQPQKGPAYSLYRDAQAAMRKKEYNRAEMLLSRALRLEPRNGWYYHAMGEAKYAQGSYEQAIQFCLRSDSLADQDLELKRSNRLLLHKAYGQTGSGSR